MKIGRFKPETDPNTHDPRGVTFRVIVGMHSIGWGICASKRCAALYMGYVCVEVMLYDKQVVEARLGEYVRTLKAIARRNQ
tara:strand:- start:242 stop:484 length:243 start_codon:yes stop_codon:yes gene_type:complete